MVFGSTPASISFAEATLSAGGVGAALGPAGVAVGVITSLGFLGYQLYKNKDEKQSSFYLERSDPSGSSGGNAPKDKKDGKNLPPPLVDKKTGKEIGGFIADDKGNVMIEPVGGSTVPAGQGGSDTHTAYPNGSNYQRLNPNGHPPTSYSPHGHGHLEGTGPGKAGQGPSIDVHGNTVSFNSPDAHWPINN